MVEKVCECVGEYKARRKQRNGKNRKFTIKDFNRITIYVNRDTGVTPLGLIAEIAYQFGYGSMFGLASRTLTNSNKAMSQFRQILMTIAGAKLIQFLLMLRSTPLIMLPWVSTIISFVILFGTFLNRGIKALDFFSDNEHVNRVAADLMESHDYLMTTYGQTDTTADYPEMDLIDAIEEFVNAEIESFNNKAEIVRTLYDFYNFINSTSIEPPTDLTR